MRSAAIVLAMVLAGCPGASTPAGSASIVPASHTPAEVAVAALGPGAASLVCSLTREINDGVSAASEQGTLTMSVGLRSGAQGDAWVIVTEHYSFPSSMS